MKTRILHILPSLQMGGAERMATHLVRHLDREFFEVAVVSLYDPANSDLEKMLEDSDIRVFHLSKSLGFDWRMFAGIDSIVQQFRPHLVHTHLSVLRYALPAMLFRGVPGKIHTVHTLAEKEVDAVGKLVQRLAFRNGVIPIAIADVVADSLRRLYGRENAVVVPNGIPINQYRSPSQDRLTWRAELGILADETVFACIANLSVPKNHRIIIEGLGRLAASKSTARLLLIGEGVMRGELEAQATSLGIRDRVTFMGRRTDIPEILNASDVVVLASNWEGCPLSILEAMAAGKPVIATAVGGVPELVIDGVTGVLVPSGDAAALSEAMARLMTDFKLRMNMGLAGAARAEQHFSAEVMAQRYAGLYETLLAPSCDSGQR